MKILVTGASKHGSTLDIIDAIARALIHRGFDVVDKQVDEVDDLTGYDAAVIGSGVYVGKWMPEAMAFTRRYFAELRRMPVWLFSSGPLGDPPAPAGEPTSVAELTQKLSPRGHRVFAGRLESDGLGLGEKLIVAAVHAPKGDFRDMAAVEAWANEIADELATAGGGTVSDTAEATRKALLEAAIR